MLNVAQSYVAVTASALCLANYRSVPQSVISGSYITQTLCLFHTPAAVTRRTDGVSGITGCYTRRRSVNMLPDTAAGQDADCVRQTQQLSVITYESL